MSNSRAAVVFACSHTVGCYRIKQNSVLLSLKKFFFYPVMLKPASSQSSDFARGWEEVAGEGKVGGRARRGGGMADQGDIKGQTSADTQLSKPNQLHFVGNLRPITARSLKREKETLSAGWLLLVFYRLVRVTADPSTVFTGPGVSSLPWDILRITFFSDYWALTTLRNLDLQYRRDLLPVKTPPLEPPMNTGLRRRYIHNLNN